MAKKTTNKRVLSLIMTVVVLLTGFLCIDSTKITASAATRLEYWYTYYGPNLNGNRIEAYCQSTIKVYLDASLRTAGSKNGNGVARYYNACATSNDLIYIYRANSQSCYISYPVGSTRRYGYIKTSELLVLNHNRGKITSRAKVNTFRQSNLSTKAGEVWVGDSVFSTGRIGNSYRVTYNVGKNWKSAWVSRSDYIKICGSSVYAMPHVTCR